MNMFATKAEGEETTEGVVEASETVLGALTKMSGQFTSQGDVVINGAVDNGELDIGGQLLVGESAKVNGTVKAARLIVNGLIEGNVHTSGDVEVGSNGRIQGDLMTGGNLIIHPGGKFLGKSMMEDSSGEPHKAPAKKLPKKIETKLFSDEETKEESAE